LGHDGHAVVDVNCDKQLAAGERALSVRWVRLTPAKGLEGRVSGTDATTRPGNRRDGQLQSRAETTFDRRLTRSGAREASEIVMLTLRTPHFSRAAIYSTSVTAPAAISSNQHRPRAIECDKLGAGLSHAIDRAEGAT